MSISVFRGLNTVTDPMRLGMEWLVQADNVDITDTGGLAKRTGYTQALAGAFTGAYSTADFGRMYVVDGGVLKAMSDSSTAVALQTGLRGVEMHWTEINDQVFFNDGLDSGIIRADNTVLDWRWTPPSAPTLTTVTGSLAPGLYQVRCTNRLSDGRATGAGEAAEIVIAEGEGLRITGAGDNVFIALAGSTSYQYAGSGPVLTWNARPDELGADLNDTFNDPLPLDASVIQAWRGRIFAAQYFPSLQQSAVWFSQPLGFHLFDLSTAFFLIPGHVLMLAPHDDALVIGTDEAVLAYDGKQLSVLAEYGVVAGHHWSLDEQRLLFWSTRGLCAAMPFANLTERQVSVAPGVSAGGTVVLSGGQKRYLVALKQGGAAFNSHS